MPRDPPSDIPGPVGGRLALRLAAWDQIAQSPSASATLREGVMIQFGPQRPPLSRQPREFPTSRSRSRQVVEATQQLLAKGAIEVVNNPNTPGFYSRLFVVPKASGGVRPVIDLSALNRYLLCPHFQMETAESIRHSVLPGEWVTSVDIQDAYLHIPVAPSVRRYFRFVVQGTVYQFRVLPFGLSTAPREFTQLLRPVLQYLRQRGIKVHAYLDDWIVRAASRDQCHRHTQELLETLEHLGWLVNYPKSELEPRQAFEFLSMAFDTVRATVAPAPKFQTRVHNLALQTRRLPRWTARRVHSLIGLLQFLATLTSRGRLHLRPLQRWMREHWSQRRGEWSDLLQLDQQFHQALQWWDHPDRYVGIPLVSPTPTINLCTDASMMGWGAHLEDASTSGRWPRELMSAHINELELRAVSLAISHFADQLTGQCVRLYCDNSTTVAYLRKEGGTRSDRLSELAEETLILCDDLSVCLLPVHLPGARNVRADALSRRGMVLPGEWTLQAQALHPVFEKWGWPLIDLFATRANAQLPVYVSPLPDQSAWRIDALSFPWDSLGLVYAYPPAPLISRVIRILAQSRGTRLILIAPDLPLRSWYPDLRQLVLAGPLHLPLRDWPLRQRVPGMRGWQYHENQDMLRLAAWMLSSTDSLN